MSESKLRYRDADWLRKEYIDNTRSSIEIAEECSVSTGTICRWLNKHGIDVRSSKEQTELYKENDEWKNKMSITKTDGATKNLQRKEWVEQKYIVEDLSSYDLADLCGVTRPTVINWLRRHGIDVDDPGPRNPGNVQKLKDAEWLRKQYVDKQRTTPDIGSELDVDHSTVRKYLNKHGIEIREMVGENHHQWNGGYDDYYGPNWYDQRREALRRDQHRCQRCRITEPDHIENNGRGLHIHHIKPFRTFDDFEKANDLGNLKALCTRCHSIVESRIQEVDGR